MKQECKAIIGQKPPRDFSSSERELIVKEYLNSNCTKRSIWKKYTGQVEEKGNLLIWIRQLGYEELYFSQKVKSKILKKKTDDPNFENLQLKNRLAELEMELQDAKMRAVAYSTMVDIAEKEFKISIRKKFNTKP